MFLLLYWINEFIPRKSLFPPRIRQNQLPAWQNQNLLHGSNLLDLFLRLSKFADLEANPSSKRVLLHIKFWSMDQIWVLVSLQYLCKYNLSIGMTHQNILPLPPQDISVAMEEG